VPFAPIAGEEVTLPPVRKLHLSVPVGVMAYRLSSLEPTYIVPSEPIAGEDVIEPPVWNVHCKVPFGLMA